MNLSRLLSLMALAVLATVPPSYAQDPRSTIPDALAQAGVSLSRHTTTPSGVAPDITTLLRDTDVIVRGTIGPPRTYLSKDEKDVYTDYPLINPIVLFDPAVRSSRIPGLRPGITVTVLGGSIQIGALTFTSKPDALPELPVGTEGLFLLERIDDKYQPVGRFFGAFEISGDQVRRPFTPKQLFADEYRGASASATAQSWVAAVAKRHQERK